MDFGQALRQLGRSIRAWIAELFAWLRKTSRETIRRTSEWAAETEGPLAKFVRLRGMWRVVVFLILVLIAVYPLAAWWASTIDDDPDFGMAANSLKLNESLAVANAAALLDREVNTNGWTPNDTVLWPTTLLDNMPNYQQGMLTALAHFSAELAASVPHDEDLKEAKELLEYPADVWIWQPSALFWPASSEHKYNNAVEVLRRYNGRLATNAALFDRRANILASMLTRVTADLSATASAIDARIADRSGFLFINNKADDLFYRSKGQMYGYYIILKGLEHDFAGVIKERHLETNWRRMMDSLRHAVALRPWVVLNAEPDSSFATCVLCSEGFYLLRARNEMQGIVSSLAK